MKPYELTLKREEMVALYKVIMGWDLTPNEQALVGFIRVKLQYELHGVAISIVDQKEMR